MDIIKPLISVNKIKGSAGFKMLDKVLYKGRKAQILNFRGKDGTKTKKSMYKYDLKFTNGEIKRNISEYSKDLIKTNF